MLETGDFGGDKLGGLEFEVFRARKFRSTANTWSRLSAENERIWRQHKRRRTQKTHFSEFAVFSAFCSKKRSGDEAVTSLVTSSAG